MHLGHFPDRQIIGCLWQRLQTGQLCLFEAGQRLFFGGAVDTLPCCRLAPHQHILVGLGDDGAPTSAQKVAFEVVYTALFYLAFVLWRARPTGGDQKAVVLGTLPVCLAHLGIIPTGANDGSLQIVNHQALRDTAKELKRQSVALQPGFDPLIEHKVHKLVTAPGQRHHESPGLADFARLRLDHITREPEINLGFFTGFALDPYRHLRRSGIDPTHETQHRGVTSLVATLL